MKDTIDLIVTSDGGSLVGIQPLSEGGKAWFEENVATEPWQWLGQVCWIDARYAADLLEGAAYDGLEVQS